MIVDKVNAFLIIGSMFHGIGASIAVNKPVVLADPYSNHIINMSELKDRIIKRRYAAITKAKEAKNFAVIISTKIGQFVPEDAARIKKKISSYGKVVNTIIADEIQPDLIRNFQEVQVFVNTACPRISYDDADQFTKPVLTPKEILVAIGELKWEDLLRKGFL
jgi:2-(3-amino-3-carboxypropyl)histidine synthase